MFASARKSKPDPDIMFSRFNRKPCLCSEGDNSFLYLQRSIGNQATLRFMNAKRDCVSGDSTGTIQTERDNHNGAAAETRSLFLTEEGTETITQTSKTIDEASNFGTATLSGPGCSVAGFTGSFTNIPNGETLAASLSGNALGRAFSMRANFTPNSADGSPAGGEYRQYVRGEFTRNGTTVTHPLAGTNLNATTFQEDGAIIGGRTYKYGYRSNRFASSYFDNPDQLNGADFNGHDYPRITGSSGDQLTINLDFCGELVDICNSGNVLQTAEWSVAGFATVP